MISKLLLSMLIVAICVIIYFRIKIAYYQYRTKRMKRAAKLMASDDTSLRESGMKELSKLGIDIIGELTKQLKGDDVLFRGEAVRKLARLQRKEYAKDIAGLLNDRKGYYDVDAGRRVSVCWTAIKALGELDAKEYADNIKVFINDEDEDVRKMTEEVLKKWNQLPVDSGHK